MIKILGIPSCIHRQASSQQMLHLMKRVAGSEWTLDIADLSGLPLFNRDLYHAPTSFQKSQIENFRNLVEESHAVIFCASEFPLGYPYSVSAPLKNAIDWAVTDPNLFENKSAAFIAVDGMQNSGINCYHLRQLAILCGLNCLDKYHFSLTVEDCDPHTGDIHDHKVDHVRAEVTKVIRALVHECQSEKKRSFEAKHFHLVSPEVRLRHLSEYSDFLW